MYMEPVFLMFLGSFGLCPVLTFIFVILSSLYVEV